MSFSTQVKNELCGVEINSSCCAKAELCGIISFCGNIVHQQGKNALRIRTENINVAKRIQKLLEKSFGFTENITERIRKNGKSIYAIYIYEQNRLEKLIKGLGLFSGKMIKFNINPFIINEDCCKRAYLRGAFLGGGSVTSPDKSYHFEIETHYQDLSRDLLKFLEEEDIPAKNVERKSGYVTYIKDSDQIGDIIALMGATDAFFYLYNIKIEKNMKNKINRKVNCEVANINKITSAAVKQIGAIKKLAALGKKLPDRLAEVASLRLEYPEASITELGNMLSPPISKSGVNHRLKKIMETADKITENQGV